MPRHEKFAAEYATVSDWANLRCVFALGGCGVRGEQRVERSDRRLAQSATCRVRGGKDLGVLSRRATGGSPLLFSAARRLCAIMRLSDEKNLTAAKRGAR